MSARFLISYDWRVLSREGLVLGAILLLSASALCAVLSGRTAVENQRRAALRLSASEEKRMAKERATAQQLFNTDASTKVPPEYGPLHPLYVRNFAWFSAILPAAPLESLSRGASDLAQSAYLVSLPNNLHTFKTPESTASPLHLLIGPFDLSLVIVVMYSLVVVAISYSLLASEYESGTISLIRSNPVSMARLVTSKLLSRELMAAGLAVLICTIGVAGVLNLTPTSEWVWRMGVWLIVTLAYGLFWVAAAGLVNVFSTSSFRNVVILGSLWLFFVALIPAGLRFTAARLYPVAERVDFIEAIRRGPEQFLPQSGRLRAEYLKRHPEYQRAQPYPQPGNSLSAATARSEEFSRSMDQLAVRYDGQQQKQIAFVESWSWLSPALLVELALEKSAGSGWDRQETFRAQVNEYVARVKTFFWPRMFEEAVFTPSDYENIPRFQFDEQERTIVLQGISPLLTRLGMWNLLAVAVLVWLLLTSRSEAR